MDQDHNNDFDSLSQMLNRNRERRMNDNSVTNILRELDNKETREDAEEEVKPYYPSSETSPDPGVYSDSDATRMMDLPDERQASEIVPDYEKAARRNTIRRKKARQLKRQERIRLGKRTAFQIFMGVFLSVCVVGVSAWLGTQVLNSALDFTGIVSSEFEVQVDIPENATTQEVAEILADRGLINMPKLFIYYAEHSEDYAGKKYVPGTFTLSSAMSYSRILSTLQSQSVQKVTVEVRIMEGMTAREIGELLEEKCVCRAEDFMEYYKNKMDVYSFEKRVLQESHKFYQLEGYLYPDTYDFYVVNELQADPDADIDTSKQAEVAAKKIYSNFNSKITKTMYKQMNAMGLTLDDLITLASMVQAEAGTVEDMGLVASVFMNRLHNGEAFPHLESDVTYFYVRDEITPYYSDVDPSASLSVLSDAYDTYTAVGIPAGPVCNPGMDAIEAVLNYPETNYYYFCANEETGETFFATTVEEHEQNLILAGISE